MGRQTFYSVTPGDPVDHIIDNRSPGSKTTFCRRAVMAVDLVFLKPQGNTCRVCSARKERRDRLDKGSAPQAGSQP